MPIANIFFRYITRSDLIKKGLEKDGLDRPKSVSTVARYVQISSENKRKIVREKIKEQAKNGARFAVALDEWTCPGKRARFLNICLHYMSTSTNLGMDHVNGRLPAQAMKKMLIAKLKRFGLSKCFFLKILYVLTSANQVIGRCQ